MTEDSAHARASGEPLDPRRWAALAVLLVGAFLAPLDFFIVNVAMPAMSADLKASAAQMQLVISGYAVVFAVFLITGGRLGDIFGRKAVFMIGLAGFALASAICGLAGSASALIAGRLLQALAAAAMAPQAIASVHALFPPHERARALSIYGITIGFASIAGQLLGGALVSANLAGFGWRLIFLINLPVSIGAFAAAIPLLRDTRGAHRPRLDWGGVALSAAALTALVLPLIEGRELGWPWWTIAILLTAPFLAEAFRRYEIRLARLGGEPLVAMDVFKSPGVLRGLSAMTTLYALASFFLTFSIYLQDGLGRSALAAGIAILPLSVGFLVGSTFSPAIGALAGRAAPSVGFLFSAAGLVAVSTLVAFAPSGEAPPFFWLAPALLIIGLGMGSSVPTLFRVIVERVDPKRAGLVGGMTNTSLQVSGALGVALLGGLFFAVRNGRSDPASIAHAFSVTLLGVAGCHLVGATIAAGLGQPRRARRPSTIAVQSCPAPAE
jgi:EmrB/QacA subfamily drug resistance transporter